jgi:hypothetical protein
MESQIIPYLGNIPMGPKKMLNLAHLAEVSLVPPACAMLVYSELDMSDPAL